MNHDTCRSILRTALLGGALDASNAVRSARAELGGMPLTLNALAKAMSCSICIRYGASQLAETNGKSIDLMDLPIPSDKTDIDTFVLMLSLAYGLGYHELGHVSESDFKVLKKLEGMLKSGKANPLVESFFRIIEDVRMESAFIRKWPNTRKYLDSLTQSLLLTGFYTHVQPQDQAMSALTGYLLYRLYHDYRGDTGTRELAIEAREVCVQLLSEPVMTRLDALLPQMNNLENTSDALTMAANLAAFIKEEEKQQQASQQAQQQQGDAPSVGQSTGQAGDVAGGQQDPSQGTDGGTGQPDSQSPGQQASDGAGGSGTSVLQALQSLLDPSNADPRVGERADAIRQALGQAVEQVSQTSQGTISLNNAGAISSIETAVDTLNASPNQDCDMAEALAITSPLRRSFKRHMQAIAEADVSVNRRGRRLSASHLHRIAGGDNRVFKSVSEEIDMDTAVAIGLDSSGSMQGIPIKLTCEAVFATAVALEGIDGVSSAAFTFPGNKVILPFGGKAKHKPDSFRLPAAGRTPMDNAMYLGARLLNNQRKARRVLILVTDGRPDSPEATSVAADHAIKTGIELYVIGIGDAVNSCNFQNFIYLQSIHELPSVVTELFTRRILQAA